MATPLTLTVQNAPVPQGTSHIPPNGVNIPSGYTNGQVLVDTTAYQATDQITIEAEYSIDGGTTWTFGGGLTTGGGTHTDKNGNTVLAGFMASLPAPGTAAKGRIIVAVPSAGTLSGSVTLT